MARHSGRHSLYFCVALVAIVAGCSQQSGQQSKSQDIFADPKVAELAEAAREGNCERIDALVAQGADVNARGKQGFTPLMYSMSDGKTEGIVRLLECGADLNGNTKGFQRLLERGADPNLQTEIGDSAVAFAASRKDPDFLKVVLAHGGNPNLRARPKPPLTTNCPTPIYDAVGSRSLENLRVLIKAGADVNARGSDGETPLIWAGNIHSFDAMLVLLKAGADFRAKASDGYSVIDALDEGPNFDQKSAGAAVRRECIAFMKKNGVDFEKEKAKLEAERGIGPSAGGKR